jgi:hypothetical protein
VGGLVGVLRTALRRTTLRRTRWLVCRVEGECMECVMRGAAAVLFCALGLHNAGRLCVQGHPTAAATVDGCMVGWMDGCMVACQETS